MGHRAFALKRHFIQWLILPVVIVTIALGWKYPLLGFSVPLVMIAGMIGAFFRGRYVCGNFCPRGAFFDRLIALISRKRPIPRMLRSVPLRIIVMIGLMTFMIYRLALHPTSFQHAGYTFWVMCVITTAIGIVFGVLYHPRIWCALCPLGTIQSMIGGHKYPLLIDAQACVSCRSCEKVCPFNLFIIKDKDTGRLRDRDCLKCSECIAVCPKNALSWGLLEKAQRSLFFRHGEARPSRPLIGREKPVSTRGKV